MLALLGPWCWWLWLAQPALTGVLLLLWPGGPEYAPRRASRRGVGGTLLATSAVCQALFWPLYAGAFGGHSEPAALAAAVIWFFGPAVCDMMAALVWLTWGVSNRTRS